MWSESILNIYTFFFATKNKTCSSLRRRRCKTSTEQNVNRRESSLVEQRTFRACFNFIRRAAPSFAIRVSSEEKRKKKSESESKRKAGRVWPLNIWIDQRIKKKKQMWNAKNQTQVQIIIHVHKYFSGAVWVWAKITTSIVCAVWRGRSTILFFRFVCVGIVIQPPYSFVICGIFLFTQANLANSKLLRNSLLTRFLHRVRIKMCH